MSPVCSFTRVPNALADGSASSFSCDSVKFKFKMSPVFRESPATDRHVIILKQILAPRTVPHPVCACCVPSTWTAHAGK